MPNNTTPIRIAVVEDDVKIAQLLVDYLVLENYQTIVFHNGQQAFEYLQNNSVQMLILDWMLPGMDGLSLCQAIRSKSDIPIMMLTAKIEEIDRLAGLDSGADDYVCKPFSPKEVVARIRAMLRRYMSQHQGKNEAWKIISDSKEIYWQQHLLPLTRHEFEMLSLLLNRPGRVFSRAQLLDQINTDSKEVSDRAIDSHIKNIRKKIQAIDPQCECITSVYGVGYRFDRP